MPNKKYVNFVVTDLDDTIWDWLNMWHSSFEPYMNRISKEFNISIDELKAEFKKIHQKYRTTEASFIYQDIELLSEDDKLKFNKGGIITKSIMHEYYSLKKSNLLLYDNVKSTLEQIKLNGTCIIGFTESNAFFTKYRIKHLGLDGLIDCIYAPVDTGIPEYVYKHYNEEYWEPEITEFRYLPVKTKKPATEILEIILKDYKASKESAIYIGDKLDKDISMANEADIDSVYAKYGHQIENSKYELLRDVTHWTAEDVKREIEVKESSKQISIAKYTLHNSFSEVMNYFEFYEFGKPNMKNASYAIDIWKKVVDVQQHFNDIELRIRNLALTAFTFIMASIGYIEKENLSIDVGNYIIPYSSLLAIAGLIVLFSFFFMDRGWYHKFLLGSVKHGSSIEKKWSKYIPEMQLAKAISLESPNKIWGLSIKSKHKFWIFYGLLAIVLLFIAVFLFVLKNFN